MADIDVERKSSKSWIWWLLGLILLALLLWWFLGQDDDDEVEVETVEPVTLVQPASAPPPAPVVMA